MDIEATSGIAGLGRNTVQMSLGHVKKTDSGRAKKPLHSSRGKEVDIGLVQMDFQRARRLGAVDEHQRAVTVSHSRQSSDVVPETLHRCDVCDAHRKRIVIDSAFHVLEMDEPIAWLDESTLHLISGRQEPREDARRIGKLVENYIAAGSRLNQLGGQIGAGRGAVVDDNLLFIGSHQFSKKTADLLKVLMGSKEQVVGVIGQVLEMFPDGFEGSCCGRGNTAAEQIGSLLQNRKEVSCFLGSHNHFNSLVCRNHDVSDQEDIQTRVGRCKSPAMKKLDFRL